MLFSRAAIPGEPPHSSDLLDKESRASARRQGPPATNTRLFGRRIEREAMCDSNRRRCCRPCAYPLPVAETTIGFRPHGASESILLKIVEDRRKPHFQLATGLRRFFGKSIARRCGDLLHPEARRASPNDHLRGGISVNSQTLPGGL